MKGASPAGGILTLLLLSQLVNVLDGCTHAQAQPPQFIVSELRIPTVESSPEGLAAVMVRAADNAPHPLALMTHGVPRDASERAEMTPLAMIPQAREFARRGWTAVIVERQGFGDSGGRYAEEEHVCGSSPDFVTPVEASANQLREAALYLAARPEVNPSRMIGVGVSAGGLAMVALSGNPPPGMVAAISFAGGRGSNAPDHVCGAETLANTFGYWGRRSKVPMLWVYATNDHFFGPQLAQSFYAAFTENGGDASLVMAPAFEDDGHKLFSLAGIPLWTPMVDAFLMNHGLVLRDAPLPLSVPDIAPPSYFSRNAREGFQLYLAGAPHKAFAASPQGQFGYVFGRRTPEEAQQHAVTNCEKYAPNYPCAALMIDDQKAQN
jgi:dienelactone hydrolase